LNLLNIVAFGILSILYVWAFYNIPILAVGVRRVRRVSQKGKKKALLRLKELPVVSIIVPVRDEEKVIGRLLEALLKLDYPLEKREVVIMEGGSVDKTTEICAEYVRRFPSQMKLVRQVKSDGKPSALNCGLRQAKGEIIAVFDADNVPESDVLLQAVSYFDDPSVGGVQGKACAINAGINMFTRFISYEEAVRYEAYIGGKDALGLFVPLTGSNYFVRRSVLDDVGSWDKTALSEDMELAARLTERGYGIKYASEVKSWQENPSSLGQLFRQRVRWFRGCMEVSLKYGRLLKKVNRRCVDAELTFFGPFIFVAFLLDYLLGMFGFLSSASPDLFYTVLAQFMLLPTLVALFLAGTALVYMSKPRKLTNLLWLPFIYAYWSLQSLIALYALVRIILRRPKKWVKTVKTGMVTDSGY